MRRGDRVPRARDVGDQVDRRSLIKRVAGQLESQVVGIELTDAAKGFLAKLGYDPALGAGPCGARSSG